MVASASDRLDVRAATVADAADQRRRTGWRLVVSLYRRDVLGMAGLAILIAIAALGILAPVIADYPGAYGEFEAINLAPKRGHPFGTDELGRDILAQTVWGARSSFYVAAFATLIATGLGIVVGLLSGYFPGLGGDLFTGVIDVFLTLPVLPLIILLASVVSPSLTTLGLVIGLFSWPATARIVRGEAIRLRSADFVEATRVAGATSSRILLRHILPNAAPPIFINLSFVAGAAILAEAGIAFLGLGDPTNWSWGTILSHAQASGRFLESWWYATFPSLFITLTVVALNFLGQAMTEVLNPRLRGR
ncbi:MAG TPA: ABC transporter permease [Thermomicrobiales bacterium]|jgi:peptide/nickel transport system permease protein|nr:ABC transporter permease [Thermomicrobiales bacterium]